MATELQKKIATMRPEDVEACARMFRAGLTETTKTTLAMAFTPQGIRDQIHAAIDSAFDDHEYGSPEHTAAIQDVASMVLAAIGEQSETIN